MSLRIVLRRYSNQTGTLKDYILEFQRLANDVGLILLKICLLGGLKHELKYDVKLSSY